MKTAEAQPIVDKLAEILKVPTPTVRGTCRSTARGWYYSKEIDPSGEATIRLHPKVTTYSTVLHEFAHHMTHVMLHQRQGTPVAAHGEDWRRYFSKVRDVAETHNLRPEGAVL